MPKRDGYDNGVPSWVDLATTDVDTAKAFYEGLFGWSWIAAPMPGGMGTYWMGTIDGLLVAGLSAQPPSMQGAPSAWFTYVNVDDVDASTAKAEAAGATVMMPAQDIGESGRMSFVTDPVGATVGMWQAKEQKGAGLVNEHGALTWNEIYTPDAEAAAAFYGAVFGWTTGAMEMPDGGTYTTFLLGEDMVAGSMPPPMEGIPPHWHVWFGTSDADATAARAGELGATVLVPPTDIQVGRMASLEDPTGARFSVITMPTNG